MKLITHQFSHHSLSRKRQAQENALQNCPEARKKKEWKGEEKRRERREKEMRSDRQADCNPGEWG